ncbi:hypothetical protein WICPIJ_003540 [Wickerhamomyces pijperi]|uniref:F-box domain-containing protein n=1 Tax=Wickerhamomyces pijperi TaxID=599730 RepID=A0A9P8Q780_WICPI|nr:hypothetical protein WICPIJ_003540 [Wickerhamomyces pijperi]
MPNLTSLFDLPTEILVEITNSLSVFEIQQLLAIEEYRCKMNHLFRCVEYRDQDQHISYERFFKDIYDQTYPILSIDPTEMDESTNEPNRSLIYLVEIHSWKDFDYSKFQSLFQSNKNFVIIHPFFLQMDFSSILSELCKESITSFISKDFPQTTVVITEPDTTYLEYEGEIDPSRLIFSNPVKLISLLSTTPLSESKFSFPELRSLNLGQVPQQMLGCFDYDQISYDVRISLTENEVDYMSYDSDLLGDMAPYRFYDVSVGKAQLLTLEGFHEIRKVSSGTVKELRCLIQEFVDHEDMEFGLIDLKFDQLRVMNLGMFSTRVPPILKNLKMDSLRFLQVEGNYTLMDDNSWVFPYSLKLPCLEALNITDHPDVLNLLHDDTVFNLQTLQIAVFSEADLGLLESRPMPHLQRLDYYSFDAFGKLAYPQGLQAPQVTSFVLNGVSSDVNGNGKSLVGINEHFPHLKILQIDTNRIDYKGFETWDSEWSNLEYLSCYSMNFESMKKLISDCSFPKLHSFVTNFTTEEQLDPWVVQLQAPRLQSLSITRQMPTSPNHSSPTPRAKTHITVQDYPELKKFEYRDTVHTLTISNCPQLEIVRCIHTTTKLERFNGINLPKLQYLEIFGFNIHDYHNAENLEGVNSDLLKRSILNCSTPGSEMDFSNNIGNLSALQREFQHVADQFEYPEKLLEWTDILEKCLE